jgi:hypothetical protein
MFSSLVYYSFTNDFNYLRDIQPMAKYLVGQRFGNLTVVERADDVSNRTAWVCACDCGAEHIALAHNLLSGNTKSCGCLMGSITKWICSGCTKPFPASKKLYAIDGGLYCSKCKKELNDE